MQRLANPLGTTRNPLIWAAALAIALLALALVSEPASAQAPLAEGQQVREQPPAWIGPGREADVLKLLRPFKDGAAVEPGITLAKVQIEAQRITLELADTTGQTAQLVLLAQGGPKAFALQRAQAPTPQLAKAIEILAAAIQRNDDGSFFAVARPGPMAANNPQLRQMRADAATAAQGDSVELGGAQAKASAAAWLLLALAVLAKALRPPRTWITYGVGALVIAAASAVRRGLPFTPLHADDHAYRELGVALSLPELHGRAQTLLHDYGPAWWQLQRWTVPIFGDSHDAVGRWAAALGGLSVALATLTARRVSGRWLAALVGAAVLATSPIAARVGHSESTMVVAQLLVALALWLASPPTPPGAGRLDLLGVLAALVLLAWGHPLGPVLAMGTGMCAWALAIRPRSLASEPAEAAVAELIPDGFAGAPSAFELPAQRPALPSPDSEIPQGLQASVQVRPPLKPSRHLADLVPSNLSLAALLTGTLAVAAALAWHWSLRPELLGNRLAVQENLLPFPTRFWGYLLWWDRDWAANAYFTSVAALGLGGLWAQRRVHGKAMAWWSLLAWLGGMAALGVAGLLVVGCLTDGVRYQAPMLAVWLVTGAFAMRFADLLSPRQLLLGKGVAGFALVVSLLQVFNGSSASSLQDSQGQAYQVLRRELADQRGVLWLVAPERNAERRHVVVDLPVGRWSADGPESKVLTRAEYLRRCANGTAPEPAYIFLGPSCQAIDLPNVSTPCAGLDALLDPGVPVRAGFIKPLQTKGDGSLHGEFHGYERDPLDWRLGRARCPGR